MAGGRYSGRTARDTAEVLRGRRSGAGWIARCPAHDDRNPSLSIAEGKDGRLLLKCFRGCTFEEVIAALDRLAPGSGAPFRPAPSPRHSDVATPVTRQLIRKIWARATPAAGTLVETYLRARAIAGPPPASLRFEARLRHLSGAVAPAMVAAIQDRDGRLIGVHRTWLHPNGRGKAALDPPRAMLGSARGGAVRLVSGTGRLIVAEGIETALSLLDHEPDARIWAALSSAGLAQLNLPQPAGGLLIAADGDQTGRAAAESLANRALDAGWRVQILTAPDGEDWNDVLRRSLSDGD